jgi:rfaE bifunctional protein nucleotidyltransferase chain/domain/rfaE bifunctional protein kinase chain/domain
VSGPLVIVGDTVLDRDIEGDVGRICPDAPVPVVEEDRVRTRAGGAGLAATMAAQSGGDVVLVTALSRDRGGRMLARLLDRAGVVVIDLGLDGPTPEKIRVRSRGQSLLRLDRGTAPASSGPFVGPMARALAGAAAVLVADYGRGVSSTTGAPAALAHQAGRRPVVWDPHPRGATPVPGARLVTPNADEAGRLVPETTGDGLALAAARAAVLRRRWRVHAVAVTLGERGALFHDGDGTPLVVPAEPAVRPDPCGAGDRFAVTAAQRLAAGALPSVAVADAVRTASAWVARSDDGALAPGPVGRASAESVAARVRARGGTVVATGGCFDLLHAGHVALLQAARSLGDCLVVCLNSDASVRALKGAGRPVVPAPDRAALLDALGCVDAVVPFDEPTPETALRRLRPHVFVKGGDYAGASLAEAAALAEWGGQVVAVPYLEGRSTTRLLAYREE